MIQHKSTSLDTVMCFTQLVLFKIKTFPLWRMHLLVNKPEGTSFEVGVVKSSGSNFPFALDSVFIYAPANILSTLVLASSVLERQVRLSRLCIQICLFPLWGGAGDR